MIKNEYITPYQNFSYNGSTATKILSIPVTVDGMENSCALIIEVGGYNNVFAMSIKASIKASYKDGKLNVAVRTLYDANKKITLGCTIDGEYVHVYVIGYSMTSYTGYIRVLQSTTHSYIFVNKKEDPGENVIYATEIDTSIDWTDEITVGTINQVNLQNSFYSIRSYLTIKTDIANGKRIGTTAFVERTGVGILINKTGNIIPVKHINSGLYATTTVPSGEYYLIVDGKSEGFSHNFS